MTERDKERTSNKSMGNQNSYGTIGSQSQEQQNDEIREELYGHPNVVENDENNVQEDPYGQDHNPYGKDQFSIEGGQRQYGDKQQQYANEGGVGQPDSNESQ